MSDEYPPAEEPSNVAVAEPAPEPEPDSPRAIQHAAEHAHRKAQHAAAVLRKKEAPPGAVDQTRAPSPVTHDRFLDTEEVEGEP
jgi:hypothetical protein